MLDKEATSYADIFDALQTIAITLNLNIFQKDILNSMLMRNTGNRVFIPNRLFLQNRLRAYLSDKELQLGRQPIESEDQNVL
jgi:hypothetical protein